MIGYIVVANHPRKDETVNRRQLKLFWHNSTLQTIYERQICAKRKSHFSSNCQLSDH